MGHGIESLPGLLDATERRYEDLGQFKPSAFLLYVDQGEELFARSLDQHRLRFSGLITSGLSDPRLSLRADFLATLQNDEALYSSHRQTNVLSLREIDLLAVVSRPAEILSAKFERTGSQPTLQNAPRRNPLRMRGASTSLAS